MRAFDLTLETRSTWVKAKAAELGFDDCRLVKAERLDHEARQLDQWLQKGAHGTMSYMERHFDLRIDPTQLVPGAKSVIVLSLNYFPENELEKGGFKLSKYAYGKDYHDVIRKRLNDFLGALEAKFGSVEGRGFVDSAPVMEKAWAKRAGLGWMGKHTNILTKTRGSFYFLAVLITNLELASDGPVADHCGSCTRCIDACPTQAIVSPYVLDAKRCISYFTIELKDAELPSAFQGKFDQWMFGCDVCQDVCPWNRFSKPHQVEAFHPSQELVDMEPSDWLALSEEKFREIFSKSAVKRTKYSGLMRNIRFLSPAD
jgi:epoxyqueuosine reductase